MAEIKPKRISLPNNQQLLKLLFSDDQVTTSNTEENMQEVAYKSNQTITERGINMAVQEKL